MIVLQKIRQTLLGMALILWTLSLVLPAIRLSIVAPETLHGYELIWQGMKQLPLINSVIIH